MLNRGNTKFKRQQIHLTKAKKESSPKKLSRQKQVDRKKTRMLKRKKTLIMGDPSGIDNTDDLIDENIKT